MYEYHVMSAKTIKGVKTEVEKRTAEGWELVTAYAETKGGMFFTFGSIGSTHVLIFRRPRAG